MTKTTIKTLTTPSGTTGLAVAPWGDNEIYAVAADWVQAASPISVYGEKGWEWDDCGRQVADFRHDPRAALAEILRTAIQAGGDEPDEEEIAALLDDAAEIGDEDVEIVAISIVLESHGARFAGEDAMESAQDWHDRDLSSTDVDEWADIGVWDAATAAEFRDAGLSPDEVRDVAESMVDGIHVDDRADYYTDGDPIYSACNGDTLVQEIIDAAKNLA